MNKYLPAVLFFIACILSCKDKAADSSEEEVAPEDIVTPVTITHPMHSNMQETAEVNAVSAFLLKTYVKSNAVGYLQSANIHMGEYVSKGQTLFTVKTKEAEALGNTINNLDSSLHFEGVIRITSPGNGYITQLTYTAGNYVQDGEQLAEITDKTSFVFLLDLPYELKPYLPANKTILIRLPDSTVISGSMQGALPAVDAVAQTQRFIIRVNTDKLIPEKLLAKVTLVKSQRLNAQSLPKQAVLSDEAQTAFWIMKMINDSTAVKTEINKGMETRDKVEVLSPALSDSDRIILTGNYGLSDTAKVEVVNSEM